MLISAPLSRALIWIFLALFCQDGDPPELLVLKRMLEVARIVWVLDFVNLLTVQCVTLNLFLLSLQVCFFLWPR